MHTPLLKDLDPQLNQQLTQLNRNDFKWVSLRALLAITTGAICYLLITALPHHFLTYVVLFITYLTADYWVNKQRKTNETELNRVSALAEQVIATAKT